MDQSTMDLDVESYNYDELRGLFDLPTPYSREQWRGAAKVLLRVHPDKSGLPPSYFQFFREAHTLLGSLLAGSGSRRRNENEYYDAREETRAHAVQGRSDFSDWFNAAFTEICGDGVAGKAGYGEWLSSGEAGADGRRDGEDVNAYFARCRAEAPPPAVAGEIVAVTEDGAHDTLGEEEPTCYRPAMFSSLQYDDIRSAHGQRFIPVGESDFAAAASTRTLDAQLVERARAIPVSGHDDGMAARQAENASGMRRRYVLAAELERASDMQREWRGRLDALTGRPSP